MKKPLKWYLTRHPFLYKLRYKMLLKEVSQQRLEHQEFGLLNRKEDMPEIFFTTNAEILPEGRAQLSDMQVAEKIAHWLRTHTKVGPGLGTHSEKTLTELIHGKGGVCSDVSQVFNIFCLINDIRVREWGVYHPENITLGHSFNEFFDNDLQKWVLIDPSESIIFYKKENGTPLSVDEVFTQTSDVKEHIEHRYFYPYEKRIFDKVSAIYYDTQTIPFLLANYRNKTYDGFARNLNFLPVSMVHGLMLLSGKSYRYYTTHPVHFT